jgi:hypothetical protein
LFRSIDRVKYFAYKTGFFDLLVGNDEVKEFHVDSTFKTNRVGFELFGVIANVYGSGYPIAYLIMKVDTTVPNDQESQRIAVLKLFFQTMKNQGLNPTFMFCDKDRSEINAIEATWHNNDNPILRLCLWHLKRAVKFKLQSQKPHILPVYDAQAAHSEFPFVDTNFLPVDDDARRRRQLLTTKNQREYILEKMGSHYNKHHLIPSGNLHYFHNCQIWK